jgi:hypothetical protein
MILGAHAEVTLLLHRNATSSSATLYSRHCPGADVASFQRPALAFRMPPVAARGPPTRVSWSMGIRSQTDGRANRRVARHTDRLLTFHSCYFNITGAQEFAPCPESKNDSLRWRRLETRPRALASHGIRRREPSSKEAWKMQSGASTLCDRGDGAHVRRRVLLARLATGESAGAERGTSTSIRVQVSPKSHAGRWDEASRLPTRNPEGGAGSRSSAARPPPAQFHITGNALSCASATVKCAVPVRTVRVSTIIVTVDLSCASS